MIQVLQLLTIAGGMAALFFPVFAIPMIFVFAVNLVLHYWHKNRIGNFAHIFSRIAKLGIVSKKLLPNSNQQQADTTHYLPKIKQLEKTTSKILLLKTNILQDDPIASIFWYVVELLKVATLMEITTFHALVDDINATRSDILALYEYIGSIDMAISVAALRVGLPYYSLPHFTQPTKEINLEGVYHPLLENGVPNDLQLTNKSLLLTGSNMSGKSTFIRAINLNVIASQVLHTSFTTSYTAPFFQLATSIGIDDDLIENTSYYMAEVESIGNLLELSETATVPYLFTIDEVFKGTNTIERISAAKAILGYLTQQTQHLVLVSTHDIELTQLLQAQFDLYYFQESIDHQTLSFDYLLKKGALQKRNAINILELAGYPTAVIEEARALSREIEKEKVA